MILAPLTHITPFSRNAVRFDVTGTGILLTKMLQFETEEGQHVGQRIPQPKPDEATGEPLPDKEPQQIDDHEEDDHRIYPQRVQHDEPDPDDDAEQHGAPKVDVGTALTDGQVAVERGDGHKGTIDAEDAQQRGTLQPTFSGHQVEEVAGDESQAEHGREGDEGDETQHLAEDIAVAPTVVTDTGQHGLGHIGHHAIDGVDALVVPTAGIGVDTGRMGAVETPQEHAEGMGVELREEVGSEEFATESEHLPRRTQVDAERRTPRRVAPGHDGYQQNVEHLLRGQSPIGKASVGHKHAHRP